MAGQDDHMGRMYRGVIAYLQDEQLTGRETFVVTVNADGSRTMRSICEMDNFNLVRDVTYTVNARFEAVDCFVRLISEDQFVGSGWFRFSDTHAEAECVTAQEGRLSQRFETPGRVKLFGTHPLSIDTLKCAHTPVARPGEWQPLTNCFSSSLVTNGASGPMLLAKTYDMKFIGEAQTTVRAGTFDCLYYHWDTGTGRTLEMYTTPGDFLTIQTTVPERGRRYELVEYEELQPAAIVLAQAEG
jgi:hypothetical protein